MKEEAEEGSEDAVEKELTRLSDFTKHITHSLILSLFAHLYVHHVLVSACYVLGTLAGTLDKAINKTCFLTMRKIKIWDQGE